VEGYFSDIVFENFINRQEIMVMGPPPWAFISRRGLREVVLWLLSDRPMNGAEIIRAVEEFTWGFWKPSPGSVYPLLKQLEAEGLVRRTRRALRAHRGWEKRRPADSLGADPQAGLPQVYRRGCGGAGELGHVSLRRRRDGARPRGAL